MKKLYYIIGILLGLGLASCTNTELDPLNGVFPSPTLIEYTSNATIVGEKDDAGRRLFTIDITDGTTPLHAVLVGSKYSLTANQYTEANDAVAKNGNFIIGKTTIGGKNVKQGTIDVSIVEEKETADGCENVYYISTILFLEDGTPFKTTWQGKASFEKDKVLEPELFYTDAVAQDCTLEDGSTPVTDVESHTLTIKDKAGEFVAQIKLIRSNGTKDLSGNYTVKEYAHEDLSAGNGFDLGAMFGMGAGVWVIGSYYIDNGNIVIVEPGETISVSAVENGVYTIDGSTGYSFLVAPEGYVPGGLTVLNAEDTIAQDCTLEDGSTPVTDVESHTIVMKDDAGEFVAQVKLIRSLGVTDLSGEYTVKEYAHEDFSAGNGFDLGAMFGMGEGVWVIGTYYAKDGGLVIVQPGETITVTKIADDTYKFEGSTDWVFAGKISGGEVPPQPQDNFDYTPSAEYNAASNLWKANASGNEKFYYYHCTSAEWNGADTEAATVADVPFLTVNQSTFKLSYAEGTASDWQNQFMIRPTEGHYIALAADKTYKFKVTLSAAADQKGFFKLTQYDVADGSGVGKHEGPTIWEWGRNDVKAGQLTVVESPEITGVACENINLVFDFGGNPADATIYIKDIILTEVGGEPAPAVELSEVLAINNYHAQYSNHLLSMEFGTQGFYYVPADWVTTYTPSYPVDGNFLKLELYTEDGNLAAGTYTACTTGGTINAGEFGIGYDGWGPSGTTWYTVAGGAETHVFVTDGTVEVSVAGDVYTIEVKSSALNAKYVGKLFSGSAAPSITIDGDMSDWANVEGATGESVTAAFKVASDANNIYFYVKRTTERMSELWAGNGYHYYAFDLDKNDTTGEELWGNGPYEIILVVYPYAGSADAPAFGIAKAGAAAPGTCSVDNAVIKGVVTDTGVETEISIPRADLIDIPATEVTVWTWSNKGGTKLSVDVTL
jgi:hypothetical protein